MADSKKPVEKAISPKKNSIEPTPLTKTSPKKLVASKDRSRTPKSAVA